MCGGILEYNYQVNSVDLGYFCTDFLKDLFLIMSMHVAICACISAGAHRVQKRKSASDPLELEFPVVVSYLRRC